MAAADGCDRGCAWLVHVDMLIVVTVQQASASGNIVKEVEMLLESFTKLQVYSQLSACESAGRVASRLLAFKGSAVLQGLKLRHRHLLPMLVQPHYFLAPRGCLCVAF